MAITVRDRRHDRQISETIRKERSGKGKGKFFGLRLTVPEEPIKIHFQKPKEPYRDPRKPNDYYLWRRGAKHYIPKVRKFLECAYKECLTCAYMFPQDYGLQGVKSPQFLEKCWAKDYYALAGWVEEWHLLTKKDGNKNDENGKPVQYTQREIEREVKKRLRSEGLKPAKVQAIIEGSPRVFGSKFYLDISRPAWENEFGAVYEEVERMTRDNGYLFPLSYGCASCGAAIEPITERCIACHSDEAVGIDYENHKAFCGACDSDWSLLESRSEDLKLLGNTLCECDHCNYQGCLVPMMAKMDIATGEVTTEQPEGGWETFDIFDIQLTVRTKRTSEDAPPILVIDSWKIQEPDPKLFDVKHQGEGEEAKKIAERNKEPLDLDKVHQADGPSVQAQVLGLPNLFSARASEGAMTQKTVRYQKAKEEAEPDGEAEEETEE